MIDNFVELQKVVRRGISVHIRLGFVKVNIVTVRAERGVRYQFARRNSDFNALFAALVLFVFFFFGKSLRCVFKPFYSPVSGSGTVEVKKTYFGFLRSARVVAFAAVVAFIPAGNSRGGYAQRHSGAHCSFK